MMVSRDAERAREAVSSLAGLSVDTELADLSVRAAVDDLADRCLAKLPAIHLLVNCAGAFYGKRRETVDGHEMTFVLDHLAPFQLTCRLLPRLRETGSARVINLCTRFYADAPIDADDLHSQKRYGAMRAYSRAKLANILFTFELARREDPARVAVNAVQRGDVYTNAAQNSGAVLRALYRVVGPLFFLSPEQGADTVVWAGTDEKLRGVSGKLLRRRAEVEPAPLARDAAVSAMIWAQSERMTRVMWPPPAPSAQ